MQLLWVIRPKLSKDKLYDVRNYRIGAFQHNCLAQYIEILVHEIKQYGIIQ